MDLARERVRDGAPDGLVVVAAVQTEGRGRRGSRWHSPRGGLWISVVVRPGATRRSGTGDAARASAMPGLTIAGALAAAAACSTAAGLDVRVKWPNDLYIGDAKVGGVSGETEAGAVVLGIGINANVAPDGLPVVEYYRTTSLAIEAGVPADLEALLGSCLVELDARLGMLERGGLEALLPEWRERSLELGRAVVVQRGEEVVRGVASDIGSDGSLIIETGGRRVAVAAHGDVTMAVEGVIVRADEDSY